MGCGISSINGNKVFDPALTLECVVSSADPVAPNMGVIDLMPRGPFELWRNVRTIRYWYKINQGASLLAPGQHRLIFRAAHGPLIAVAIRVEIAYPLCERINTVLFEYSPQHEYPIHQGSWKSLWEAQHLQVEAEPKEGKYEGLGDFYEMRVRTLSGSYGFEGSLAAVYYVKAENETAIASSGIPISVG